MPLPRPDQRSRYWRWTGAGWKVVSLADDLWAKRNERTVEDLAQRLNVDPSWVVRAYPSPKLSPGEVQRTANAADIAEIELAKAIVCERARSTEITPAGVPFPTRMKWFDAQDAEIMRQDVTWSGAVKASEVWTIFNSSGGTARTMTTTFTYAKQIFPSGSTTVVT